MDLIIVNTLNDISKIKDLISPKTELLVFNQDVMHKLDQLNLSYKTIENFYISQNYIQDTHPFRNEVKKILRKLDKTVESYTTFPFSYSGNELYFLTWFDDLFYLERLIQIIKQKYEKIYLISYYKPENVTKLKFDYSVLNSKKINGSISFPYERLDERFLQLFFSTLDIIFIKDKFVSKNRVPIKNKLIKFFNRVHKYFLKFINKNKLHFDSFFKLKKRKAYLIQDSYEVLYLKKYLSNFRYSNPMTQLRIDIENKKFHKPIDSKLVTKILEKFIDDYFNNLNTYMIKFVISYHNEIVTKINFFKNKFDNHLLKDKPIILLLGLGTRDVFDTICCYLANINKIPVIIFQHGGSRVFFYTPYQESLEYNDRVYKSLIVQSENDEKMLSNNKTNVLYLGSIEQYENNNKNQKRKPSKEILYILGPDTNFSFRHLLNNFSVKLKYKHSKDVLNIVTKNFLKLDLKLHPNNENESYHCYKRIIKEYKNRKINIIYGGFADIISKNYELIIIDNLGTGTLNNIFSLDIPVIIYHSQFDFMNLSKEIFFDLSRRCYIARNKNELDKILLLFKEGNLSSKWSNDIINRYAYPYNKGNPGENINQYIESIVK